MGADTRRPASRIRRLSAVTAVAAGLIAAFIYMFLVLIEAERGNPFRGWIMYVFCAAAFALAAAGTIADNIRLNRRPQTPTETHPNTPTATPPTNTRPQTPTSKPAARTRPNAPTSTSPTDTHPNTPINTSPTETHPVHQSVAHTQTPTGASPVEPHSTHRPAAHTQTPTGTPPAHTLSGTDPNPAH